MQFSCRVKLTFAITQLTLNLTVVTSNNDDDDDDDITHNNNSNNINNYEQDMPDHAVSPQPPNADVITNYQQHHPVSQQ